MLGSSILIGLRGGSADAHLPEVPSPACATALAQAIRQTLDHLREAIPQLAGDMPANKTVNEISRQLQSIAGVFRFCGAHSLDRLSRLMHDVVTHVSDAVSSAEIQALTNGCSMLIASLSSLQRGHSIPAGWLLPVWRELAAHVPGHPPSASEMISLASLGESEKIHAARVFLSSHHSAASVHGISVPAVDKMLLDFLRADAGSAAWHDSLGEAAALISYLKQNMDDPCPRLHWAVMLVYCELLAADAPMDIALAKKNLSLTIRVIRQAAQQSFLSVAVLPDSLVREVLFQIGLFAPLTATSQKVRECFILDWQLSPYSETISIGAVNQKKYQLLAHLDKLEAVWAQAGPAERRRQIDIIMAELEALSALKPLASTASSLLALLAVETVSDLPAAAVLLIVRFAVDAFEGAVSSPQINTCLLALEAMREQVSTAGVTEQQWWYMLAHIVPGRQQPAAISALRDAVRSVLMEAEHRLEPTLESVDVSATLRDMILSVDCVAGALKLAGMTAAVQVAEALRKELRDAQEANLQAATVSSIDKLPSLAFQWVQLCHSVDTCAAEIEQVYVHDDPALMQSPGAAMDISAEAGFAESQMTGSPLPLPVAGIAEDLQQPEPPSASLEKIFIQEATQRLSRLR